jgi:hypothetical protein
LSRLPTASRCFLLVASLSSSPSCEKSSTARRHSGKRTRRAHVKW